ncbi:MAG: C-terminal binding protein, partial [Planctomycetaceae bacterium]|nr:C-terminal binding protein [Planctomycetaceae bacterium]
EVVITDFITGNLEIEQSILGETAKVIALDACREEDLIGKVEQAEALMVYHAISLTPLSLERLQNCKLIVRCGVGIDNVDWRTARKLGINVANVPDYGTEEVADSAIAMALGLLRGTHQLNSRLQRSLEPWSYTQIVPKRRIRNRVFAIIGAGRIGTATALRAKALGFDVRYYDPYVPQGTDKALGIMHVETLEELVRDALVLSLHCPLTEETQNIVTLDLLNQMPRGGYLVNTARGGLVDPKVVLKAIESEQIAGAGIDVLPVEPPEVDNPLLKAWRDPAHPAFDRLILNPHAAFYCEEGLMDMRVKGARNCLRVLQGLPPVNVVN